METTYLLSKLAQNPMTKGHTSPLCLRKHLVYHGDYILYSDLSYIARTFFAIYGKNFGPAWFA